MKLWIAHPACQDGPVSLRRWLAFQVGEWMVSVGYRLSWWAVDPKDDIPF